MELEEFMQLLKDKKFSEVKKALLEMNEFDIASLIEELPEDMIVQAFRLLPKNMATDVFVNMDDEIQKKVISSLTSAESKAIIEDMFTDDAADLFIEISRRFCWFPYGYGVYSSKKRVNHQAVN